MRIEYSPGIDALYVRLGAGEISETVEVGADVYADLDDAGNPIGIEFLDAPEFFRFLSRDGSGTASEGVTVVDLPDGLAALIRRETSVAAT